MGCRWNRDLEMTKVIASVTGGHTGERDDGFRRKGQSGILCLCHLGERGGKFATFPKPDAPALITQLLHFSPTS